MLCEERFYEIYGRMPEKTAFCPYRICPLGAHVDHQGGLINGLALNKGIHIAYGAKQNGVIELVSIDFPKRAQFHVSAVPENKQNDWADYIRGAAKLLNDKYPLHIGISGVIEGSLPIGGLSSSASVTICFLTALCDVNHIYLEPFELVMLAKRAENEYVGVNCGKLDQCCEVLARKDNLLYLNTKDDTYELIATPANMKPYKIMIFFSGIERTLAGSKYNLRVDECKSAAYALMAFAGMEYGKYDSAVLSDVPEDIFKQYKDRLPEAWKRRAVHYYGEVERARLGAEAFRNGDIEEYGRYVFESGRSSIYSYEAGSMELKKLYDIMRDMQGRGIYGGRFSGAGFRGCCMALVDPEQIEDIEAEVTLRYLMAFPDLAGKFSVHVCESSDGVKF